MCAVFVLSPIRNRDVVCCITDTPGGEAGGLHAYIYGIGSVLNSSMSLSIVTATSNTAAGTMCWALL
jgi:hypothetical protein